MISEDKIRKADDVFYEIFHDFRLFHYLNPSNHQTEREKFFTALEEGKTYNPLFEYNPIPDSLGRSKKKLEVLDFGTAPLDICFENTRNELLHTLEMAESRATPGITALSAKVFGKPSPELVQEADSVLTKRFLADEPPANEEVGVKALAVKLREKLRGDRIDGWDVLEDPAGITLAEADGVHHKIRLRSGLIVSEEMVERLLHHIVEIHVYRAANGERQPYKIFAIGLDRSAETEEGLAAELEERLGLFTPYVRKRYAGRVLAVAAALSQSFFDIFQRLVEFFPQDEAYTLAERCKRGLRETAHPGGFVRDHIYLSGKQKVKTLPSSDLRLLYTGKIATHHLPLIKEMISTHTLFDPAFLPAAIHG